MARLTIQANSGEKITLIISPSDAFEIIGKYNNKYPNAEKINISLAEFLKKWVIE